MQTICFDFFSPPDGLPRLQRNHGMDADTMLAQAQLLSCLASERNRHSAGCALPCISVHQGGARRVPSIHVLSTTKEKILPVTSNRYAYTHLLLPGHRHTASSGITEFISSDTSPFKQVSNSVRAISSLGKFQLLLFSAEPQQISPADMSQHHMPRNVNHGDHVAETCRAPWKVSSDQAELIICHSLLAQWQLLQIQQLYVMFTLDKEGWQHCTMATSHSPWDSEQGILSRQEQNSSGKTMHFFPVTLLP